jgi:hypothetical protein
MPTRRRSGAYETLVDPGRRRRYDRQPRAARLRSVVVREVIVTPPFAEPLLGSRHTFFGVPRTWVTVPRSSFFDFDGLVEDFFAFFDDRRFGRR